ncbi:testis-expressed protein 11-like isoform X1 [Pomacea canaliculata]|uniref:testis-expressed protein 11-like isoform X1 n=1 Tax=Pomacea canaliculata TaxID=400727 RepID=UPI000D72FD12|nr:testis-expressed protein 11-like isoform X1 [Pomacea canaliculata]XP_025099669.1 testis-expressed protein 11-like isoform X1 [Pomacea canaliculata]XP_025099670.1 testis-expressed protein 11-like isoform X1 [Pomacea canaliculata]XP_025099671.1 testis-expressed protein 11-like isoform X1 [Pomacea canaliculata]
MINIQQEEPRDCEAGSEDHSQSLLSLAAQMALEHKHVSLAKIVLKSLMETNSDRRQTLKAARCLIRLTLTSCGTAEACMEADERTDLLSYFRIAHSSLLALRGSEDMGKETLETEAAWFMKVAWNFALKNDKDLSIMKDLFLVCYNLMPLCKTDKQTLDHKKACLLMATAACIQMARSTDSRQDMKRLLEEALAHISESNSVDSVSLEATWRNGESQVLLLLYEFEALVKLFDPRAESVLERALVIPNSEPRIFESLAALAMERPVGHFRLAIRALKMAVHLHLTAQHPDFGQCSKDIHSLIQISLSYSEDEAFTYFREAADMIEKRAEGEYPQMETIWLMTKAWNTGIRHYCSDQYRQAEQWCVLSMRFLTHLGSLRLDYEGQMMSVYSEILDNLDKQKSAMDVTMK